MITFYAFVGFITLYLCYTMNGIIAYAEFITNSPTSEIKGEIVWPYIYYIIAQAYLRCCTVVQLKWTTHWCHWCGNLWLGSLVVRALDLLQLIAMSSNPCNMAIFQFFNMAAAAIVDFRNFKFLTVGRSRGSNYVTTPNFVEIGPNAAEILRFIGFSRWRRRHLAF